MVVRSDPPGASVLVLPSEMRFETPAEIELKRLEAATIFIEKKGYLPVRAYLDRESDWNALLPYLGNILIGGLIGMSIDLSSGALPRLDPDVVDVSLEPIVEGEVSPPPFLWTQRTVRLVGSKEAVDPNAKRTKLDDENLRSKVLIPSGLFLSGCNQDVDSECYANEGPGQSRSLDAFRIDATEVTTTAYRDCVASGSCTEAGAGNACNGSFPDQDLHPQNCVDWDQARVYCTWRGMRLPTEWEWEKASRGTDGRRYPWGNEPADCEHAVIENDRGSACGHGETTFEVGSKPIGSSPYGIHDMSGNVAEWTEDTIGETSLRSVRGGSWFDSSRFSRVSFRGRYPANSQFSTIGFRCAE